MKFLKDIKVLTAKIYLKPNYSIEIKKFRSN